MTTPTTLNKEVSCLLAKEVSLETEKKEQRLIAILETK